MIVRTVLAQTVVTHLKLPIMTDSDFLLSEQQQIPSRYQVVQRCAVVQRTELIVIALYRALLSVGEDRAY